MDFEQISDKEKKALHIDFVSESRLVFRKVTFDYTIEFDKYNNGKFGIELRDSGSYYFTKEQLAFIVKWISYPY